MTIDEICKRLGLKNSDELASMLDFGDRLDKIRQLAKMRFFIDESLSSKIDIFYHEDVSCIVNSNVKRNPTKLNFKRRGWYCILKGRHKDESVELSNNRPRHSELPKNVKNNKNDNIFETGHILARFFYKYINSYKVKDYSVKQVIDDESLNLFVEFRQVNQLQFQKVEQVIDNFLKDGSGEIFYEVKIIFKDENDIYPIGVEIFYKTLKSNKRNQNIQGHLFIPNLDKNLNLSSVEEYSRFYQFGYNSDVSFYRSRFTNIQVLGGFVSDSVDGQLFYLVKNVGVFNSLEIVQNLFQERKFSIKDIEELSVNDKFTVVRFNESNIKKVQKYFKNAYPVTKHNECGLYFEWPDAQLRLKGFEGYPAPTSNLLDGMSVYEGKNGGIFGMNWIKNKNI